MPSCGVTRPHWVNHRYLDFFRQRVHANDKNMEAPHYWPLVTESPRWPMDSTYKGPVIRKAIPYHDVIVIPGNHLACTSVVSYVYDQMLVCVFICFTSHLVREKQLLFWTCSHLRGILFFFFYSVTLAREIGNNIFQHANDLINQLLHHCALQNNSITTL